MTLPPVDHTNARTTAALNRLQKAMSEIEADIAAHHGVYPFNHGRVTQSELCRRADVKKATLQNPLHKDTTRVQVMAWLDGLNATLMQTRDGTRERVTAVADHLGHELAQLRQALQHCQAQLQSAQVQSTTPPNSPLVNQTTDSDPFQPGVRLRHHKGGLYTVVGICLIEATLMPGVLYTPCQGDMQNVVWMRPLDEFNDLVSTPNGTVPRFVILQDPLG